MSVGKILTSLGAVIAGFLGVAQLWTHCWGPRQIGLEVLEGFTAKSYEPVRPLACAGHVHDAAVLVESHVVPLVALEAVQRQVVIPARHGEVRELVRLLRVAEPPTSRRRDTGRRSND